MVVKTERKFEISETKNPVSGFLFPALGVFARKVLMAEGIFVKNIVPEEETSASEDPLCFRT
jgi:hypothetical protein